jgi:hypothetical protein
VCVCVCVCVCACFVRSDDAYVRYYVGLLVKESLEYQWHQEVIRLATLHLPVFPVNTLPAIIDAYSCPQEDEEKAVAPARRGSSDGPPLANVVHTNLPSLTGSLFM